jgi:hypothetical protein
MTRGRRGLLAALVAAMLALLALRIEAAIEDPAAPITVDLGFTGLAEAAWNRSEHLVVDGRAGHRPRRSFAQPLRVAPLGAPQAAASVTRSTEVQGLVGDEDLPATIPGPRILVLGDDQTMGSVPAAANWTARLEALLQAADPRLRTARVLNAGCDEDGLVHYALRGPPLIARYAPRLVLVAVSSGDDLVALDDRRLPHVDDTASAAGPAFPPAADPLALGPRAAALCPDHPALARRGLAQAAYLQAVAEREAVLGRKARQALLWLREIAPRGRLLVALIPPADLARPEQTAAVCSPAGRELIASGTQARAHRQLLELCVDLGLAHVDTLPFLAAAAGDDLYQTDGRLGPSGHRLVAEALRDRVLGFATRR